MIHPDVELRHCSEAVGSGLFATSFIPCGTLIYVQDEMELVFEPHDRRLSHPMYLPVIERFSYRDHLGRLIMSWDLARYENHSCQSNTMSTGYGFEIAIRDIEKDEEVTDDYGLFNMLEPLNCRCGTEACRGIIYADDLVRHHAEWDAIVQAALTKLQNVPQPLIMLVDQSTREQLDHYLATGRGYRSVKSLRYCNGTSQPQHHATSPMIESVR